MAGINGRMAGKGGRKAEGKDWKVKKSLVMSKYFGLFGPFKLEEMPCKRFDRYLEERNSGPCASEIRRPFSIPIRFHVWLASNETPAVVSS